ncbi:aldo/keto reductase [Glaciihabitans arcticus]|uniref:Aldo/keto reductase n=1 Tax=Glaciihabitans arcticus TaxID=2668039 RepID=A0A4Q9GXS8_9MICO|nr:aldo/keto reductase [Glaciihabitans arcticus]TBN58057.1 aldo/keto reductase [Glaciihabitans arcticus]
MTSELGPVVLGGNVFGWTANKDESFAVLDAFVAAGGRSIDTADVYSAWVPGNAGGDSEEIIGEWVASRGNRDSVHIATKVSSLEARPGLSAANLAAAVDDSLRRLQTDYIDLYYAHNDDKDVAQEEYVAAFDALVKAGKVRAVGASNFEADRVRSAVEIAKAQGLTPFTFAQDRWSLVERGIETGLVPTLAELGITELPYSSLASGFLSGKYRAGGPAVDSPRAGGASRYLEVPANIELLSTLDDVATAHGADVASVALAWLRAQDVVGAPIASARTVAQVPALMNVIELTAEELAALS